MKKKLLKLLLVVLLVFLVSILDIYGQSKINIAVLDFSSQGGLTEAEAITLTNRFRSMLVKTKVYNVLERGRMEEVLGEIGFQMTGCTSTECAVEVGKILNVQQMIAGNIGKLGKTYTVDISVIDVGTAKIIKTLYEDYIGEIDGLLALMEPVSVRLAGIEAKEEVTESRDEGSLSVITGTVIADVYLNNQKFGQTPLKKDNIRSGEYTITLKADGYADLVDKVHIKRGATTEFRRELQKYFTIFISSQPPGAKIFINNQYLSTTPKKQTAKAGMSFQLKIVKEKYQEWVKDITMDKDLNISATLELLQEYNQQLTKTPQQSQPVSAKKGSKKWLWITGGTVVAGGAAAILLSGGNKDESPSSSDFPTPPGRP